MASLCLNPIWAELSTAQPQLVNFFLFLAWLKILANSKFQPKFLITWSLDQHCLATNLYVWPRQLVSCCVPICLWSLCLKEHFYERDWYDVVYHALCIMKYDVMKYDVTKYNIMNNDVMQYDVILGRNKLWAQKNVWFKQNGSKNGLVAKKFGSPHF